MGRSTRLELATSRFTVWRSNQLNYDRHRCSGLENLFPNCPRSICIEAEMAKKSEGKPWGNANFSFISPFLTHRGAATTRFGTRNEL